MKRGKSSHVQLLMWHSSSWRAKPEEDLTWGLHSSFHSLIDSVTLSGLLSQPVSQGLHVPRGFSHDWATLHNIPDSYCLMKCIRGSTSIWFLHQSQHGIKITLWTCSKGAGSTGSQESWLKTQTPGQITTVCASIPFQSKSPKRFTDINLPFNPFLSIIRLKFWNESLCHSQLDFYSTLLRAVSLKPHLTGSM